MTQGGTEWPRARCQISVIKMRGSPWLLSVN